MRLAPTVPVGLKDLKLITLLTSIVKCLKNHPDHECYTVTVVWQVPFTLLVPERGNTQPRNIKPNIIRLGNAVLASNPETVVEWGAATNWVWQGNSQVKILNQAGLLEGVRYTLTFEVVS